MTVDGQKCPSYVWKVTLACLKVNFSEREAVIGIKLPFDFCKSENRKQNLTPTQFPILRITRHKKLPRPR